MKNIREDKTKEKLLSNIKAIDRITNNLFYNNKKTSAYDVKKSFRNIIDFIKDQSAGAALTLGAIAIIYSFKNNHNPWFLGMAYAVIIAGTAITAMSGIYYACLANESRRKLTRWGAIAFYIIISLVVLCSTAYWFGEMLINVEAKVPLPK